MRNKHLDRSIRFFGQEGQDRLRATKVGVVGIGGIGTHVVQQLSLLRIGTFLLIDPEELDETNRNRYVGACHNDPIPGTRKVDLGERIAASIDPTIQVQKVCDSLLSEEALVALTNVTHVFGCVDKEGLRLVLTEFCAAYAIPYIDVASEIDLHDQLRCGGRVLGAWAGDGCLVCMNQLDRQEAAEDLASPEVCRDREAIYGVNRELLGRSGPSVASINGVVASLAVTEFMLACTGIRAPKRLLSYRGDLGTVSVSKDLPTEDCYYCKGIRGLREKANVLRYAYESPIHI